MGVDYRVFYGYGYDIPSEKASKLSPEKYDELIDSEYAQVLDGYSDDSACFFGLILATVEGCTLYQLPVIDKIDHNELHEMLIEYKNIFNESPGMAHHYIGFAVT
jgi:hypothetical protein